jgi:fructose-1,6-bisphosphatase II
MDRNLALEFVRVTEAAAIASARWMGKGDNHAADGAAVAEMRDRFNFVDFDGTVVIGEGERDEAPMLFIGEKVGTKKGLQIDLALDPLEGTTITAKGGPNAISVLAASPKGTLLNAPDTYMNKIAAGGKAGKVISLDASVEENLNAVADALGKPVEEVTAVILERDRHKELIEKVRKAGARIRLIPDGDISGAISPSIEGSGIDLLLGIGAAPEGVISAVAVKCLGGGMQGRLSFRNQDERKRAIDMGVGDPDRLLKIDDLAKGDEGMFVATGVTDGTMLKGVKFLGNKIQTHSVVMRGKTKTIRFIETLHHVK